jgi:hypothetical protein
MIIERALCDASERRDLIDPNPGEPLPVREFIGGSDVTHRSGTVWTNNGQMKVLFA